MIVQCRTTGEELRLSSLEAAREISGLVLLKAYPRLPMALA